MLQEIYERDRSYVGGIVQAGKVLRVGFYQPILLELH